MNKFKKGDEVVVTEGPWVFPFSNYKGVIVSVHGFHAVVRFGQQTLAMDLADIALAEEFEIEKLPMRKPSVIDDSEDFKPSVASMRVAAAIGLVVGIIIGLSL